MEMTLPLTEPTRRSLTIPAPLAARIDAIAIQRHVSANRVILDLIEVLDEET